jgi:hypothetical protein
METIRDASRPRNETGMCRKNIYFAGGSELDPFIPSIYSIRESYFYIAPFYRVTVTVAVMAMEKYLRRVCKI